MTENEVLEVFRDTGALLEGHFILRSGLHSRQFFQCALALQNMPTVERFGEAIANKTDVPCWTCVVRNCRRGSGSLASRAETLLKIPNVRLW